MYSIIQYLPKAIVACFGSVHISPLPTKPKGKLRLTPVQFLQTIQAHQLAQSALHLSQRFCPGRHLPRRVAACVSVREGVILSVEGVSERSQFKVYPKSHR